MNDSPGLPAAASDEVRGILDRAGLPDDPKRFVELVKEAIGRVVSARTTNGSALTEPEVRELREIGLDPMVSESRPDTVIVSTTAKMAAILADSLTVDEAAALLDLHPSRLRQMLTERTLYGIKDSGDWRIPAFQFVDCRRVRNLGPVLRATPMDLHPIELFNWLTRPEPALRVEGQAVSPIQWLDSGGDVERPTSLAAEL